MIKLNLTTFTKLVKDAPEDRVEIEVGDSKQPDFKPQLKIMRWDNEVNFSMRAEEKAGATLLQENGVIKYITPDYEVHQYDKPDASEEGGFEFEWVLKAKPATNVLSATIQTKELEFFYQGELSTEAIKRGDIRPNNVVGSYAVYHKTKGRMNDAAGMHYKSGKAFHIYRPKAIDANGVEIWADLNINEVQGILTVIVPQKFLDEAAYPVIVDPTFGTTAIGATQNTQGGINVVWYEAFSKPASNGTLDSVSLYGRYTGSAGTFNTGLYADDGASPNLPSTRLAYINSGGSNLPAANAWTTTNLSYASLVANTQYWLTKLDSVADAVYYDTGTASESRYRGTAVTTHPDPAATNTAESLRVSIYATYTAAGGAPVTTAKKHTLLMLGVG